MSITLHEAAVAAARERAARLAEERAKREAVRKAEEEARRAERVAPLHAYLTEILGEDVEWTAVDDGTRVDQRIHEGTWAVFAHDDIRVRVTHTTSRVPGFEPFFAADVVSKSGRSWHHEHRLANLADLGDHLLEAQAREDAVSDEEETPTPPDRTPPTPPTRRA